MIFEFQLTKHARHKMGIYGMKSKLKDISKSLKISDFAQKVKTVIVDIEALIGKANDMKLKREGMIEYIFNNYINPLEKHKIKVIITFGNTKQVDISKNNNYLKLTKTIIKGFRNQSREIQVIFIKLFLKKKIISYFKENPNFTNEINFELISKNDFRNVTEKDFLELKEIIKKIWNEKIIGFIENSFFGNEKLNFDLIPFPMLDQIAQLHWKTSQNKKKLDDHIKYVKDYLKANNILFVLTKYYDADDQINTMMKLKIGDAVLSFDTDFFAYETSNIIINEIKDDKIFFTKISDFNEYFEGKGITKKMLKYAMILSSSDYNYYFYHLMINFENSLEICKKFMKKTNSKKNFYGFFKFVCKLYKKVYYHYIAHEIKHSFSINFGNDDLVNIIENFKNILIN